MWGMEVADMCLKKNAIEEGKGVKLWKRGYFECNTARIRKSKM
jgi:hypothetical protein